MPLGGWTGTVTEIIEHEGQINCVFQLDERTLASLHPIFRPEFLTVFCRNSLPAKEFV